MEDKKIKRIVKEIDRIEKVVKRDIKGDKDITDVSRLRAFAYLLSSLGLSEKTVIDMCDKGTKFAKSSGDISKYIMYQCVLKTPLYKMYEMGVSVDVIIDILGIDLETVYKVQNAGDISEEINLLSQYKSKLLSIDDGVSDTLYRIDKIEKEYVYRFKLNFIQNENMYNNLTYLNSMKNRDIITKFVDLLVDYGFSDEDISNVFDVSAKTIQRIKDRV